MDDNVLQKKGHFYIRLRDMQTQKAGGHFGCVSWGGGGERIGSRGGNATPLRAPLPQPGSVTLWRVIAQLPSPPLPILLASFEI